MVVTTPLHRWQRSWFDSSMAAKVLTHLWCRSASTQSLSGSLIAGNRGDDKIVFNSTYSIFNTEVYGSDSTGTLAGNDSIILGGQTVQTSTVYGGAGADTIIVGDYGTDAGNAQLLKVDVNGFAGADSIQIGGSFVSIHRDSWCR